MNAIRFAGIDEVGRGALFGPVFAGAVILDTHAEIFLTRNGLKDSKKLSPTKRVALVPLIKRNAMSWTLGQSSAREIDLIGIRHATEKAMIRAVQNLNIRPELLIIDGNLPLRLWKGKQNTCIKGEDKYPSIAAASVLAKVARDELISRLAIKYPYYGLEKHKGYATEFHRNELKKSGPTALHRKTFLKKISSKQKISLY